MNEDYKLSFHHLINVKAITFPIVIIIVISILIVSSSPVLNRNHIAVAQQQQPFETKDLSFEIDNVRFSHHTASVNGIQFTT